MSSADNELMYSFDFELPGEPDQIAPFLTTSRSRNGNYFFDPTALPKTRPMTVRSAQTRTCYDPAFWACRNCAPHDLLRAGISNTDFVVHEDIPVTERTHFEFRGEFFNVFNHTQFYNPDGNSTDGSSLARSHRSRIRGWCNLH